MRLFVAAYPTEEAVADLAAYVRSLQVGRAAAAGTNTRLARPETYHLTLAFLGDVADERLSEVEEAVGLGLERYHAHTARAARRAARLQAGESVTAPQSVRDDNARNASAGIPADQQGRHGPSQGPGDASGQLSGGAPGGGSGQVSGAGSGQVSGGAPGDGPGQVLDGAHSGGAGRVSGQPPGAAGGGGRAVPLSSRARKEASAARLAGEGGGGGGRAPVPSVPELALAGGGRFGRGAATIMWVGVTGDLEPMRALHKALRRELKHAGFPYDQRPWKPHLTVARPGNRIPKRDLDADREALHAYTGPRWPVRELFLVRSHLGPNPSYERLTNWLL